MSESYSMETLKTGLYHLATWICLLHVFPWLSSSFIFHWISIVLRYQFVYPFIYWRIGELLSESGNYEWSYYKYPCNAEDLGSIPGWGRSPEEGNGYPPQYSCLENPPDRGAWQATVHGASELDTTERLSKQISFSRFSWGVNFLLIWVNILGHSCWILCWDYVWLWGKLPSRLPQCLLPGPRGEGGGRSSLPGHPYRFKEHLHWHAALSGALTSIWVNQLRCYYCPHLLFLGLILFWVRESHSSQWIPNAASSCFSLSPESMLPPSWAHPAALGASHPRNIGNPTGNRAASPTPSPCQLCASGWPGTSSPPVPSLLPVSLDSRPSLPS